MSPNVELKPSTIWFNHGGSASRTVGPPGRGGKVGLLSAPSRLKLNLSNFHTNVHFYHQASHCL